MRIDHKRTTLPVVGEKHIAMQLTVVEGIFHQPEKSFAPVAALGDDVIDAFVVVEGLGEEMGDERAVLGLGFEHNGIKLN